MSRVTFARSRTNGRSKGCLRTAFRRCDLSQTWPRGAHAWADLGGLQLERVCTAVNLHMCHMDGRAYVDHPNTHKQVRTPRPAQAQTLESERSLEGRIMLFAGSAASCGGCGVRRHKQFYKGGRSKPGRWCLHKRSTLWPVDRLRDHATAQSRNVHDGLPKPLREHGVDT